MSPELENRILRAALLPFAAYFKNKDTWAGKCADDVVLDGKDEADVLTAGDFATAARLVGEGATTARLFVSWHALFQNGMATYGDSCVPIQLPLTSGILLEVKKRLGAMAVGLVRQSMASESGIIGAGPGECQLTILNFHILP